MCAEPVQQRVKTVFEIMDVSHTGSISLSAVEQFLRLVMPVEQIEAVKDALMTQCESEEQNCVSYEEVGSCSLVQAAVASASFCCLQQLPLR